MNIDQLCEYYVNKYAGEIEIHLSYNSYAVESMWHIVLAYIPEDIIEIEVEGVGDISIQALESAINEFDNYMEDKRGDHD